MSDDFLHGCIPDNQYNTEDMEDDGEHVEGLEWEYADVGNEQEDINYPHYNWDRPYVPMCHQGLRLFLVPMKQLEVWAMI